MSDFSGINHQYLFSAAIGPVQDFIASARRTRDLWFGSRLLSELSKVVAKEIGKEKLIFPAITEDYQLEPDSPFNVVNKILAIVDNPEKIGRECKFAIMARLKNIYDPLFNEIEENLERKKKGGAFFRDNAIDQILEMTEFYWAAYPFAPDSGEYRQCRERVEMLLNARKSSRHFKPVLWASNAPKSSLDGQRESVILDSEIDDVEIQRMFRLRKKERLCGIGVMKRLAEEKHSEGFASTSHMAAFPLLSTLKNNDTNRKAVRDYLGVLTDSVFEIEITPDFGKIPPYLGHDPFFAETDEEGKKDKQRIYCDGHLLYANRLADLPFKAEGRKRAEGALGVFLNDAFGGKSPSPYYALLLADGDRMGTVIDKQTELSDHKDLSGALSKFAGDVEEIVKKRNGCLVYAGGDDVFAILPLHTATDCAKELADKFVTDLSVNPKFKDENGTPPTLSVGIAICHHTQPFQESLATMRRAEKEAKSVDGKNALAIIVSKRSGADTTVKGSWSGAGKHDKSFYDRMNWFTYLHLADALPDGVAYELRDLWLRLFDKHNSGLEQAIKAESVRILKRKHTEGGTKKLSESVFKEIEKFIDIMVFPFTSNTGPIWTIEDLANEIIVARDFAKAQEQAGKTAKTFAEKHQMEEAPKNDLANLDN